MLPRLLRDDPPEEGKNLFKRQECIVVDLYEIDDVPQFLEEAYKMNEGQQEVKKDDLGFIQDTHNLGRNRVYHRRR